jgi:hypothetical protein
VIETLVHAPALGLRLWDPWTRRAIAPGPEVSLVADYRPDRIWTLSRSPSGAHVLHIGPPVGAGPAPARIEVADKSRRVLPLRSRFALPHSGPLALDPLSVPGAPEGTFPIFPHPSRPTPAGWVCLRACLRRKTTGKPVPWALMEVRLGADLVAVGLSDAEGAVAAALPAPPPRKRLMGLPESTPFETAAWTFSVTFRWDVARLSDDIPDLADLAAQTAVEADTSPDEAMDAVVARAGDNVLVSGTRPAWGEPPSDERSSFLFLKA